VQGNRADRSEGCDLQLNLIRNTCTEVGRHRDQLGVIRVPGAGARHAVTERESADVRTNLDYHTGGAVPARCLFFELAANRL
jgi:hypothetical protein